MESQWPFPEDRDQLERERWERFERMYEDHVRLKEEAGRRLMEPKEEFTRALEMLATVFGPKGSHDNAWWTTWRPE